MEKNALLALLSRVQRGDMTPASAAEALATLPFEQTAEATIDHHRSIRSGMPEVIFGAGKTPQQIAHIFDRLAATNVNVLATRCSEESAVLIQAFHPEALYHPLSRAITLRQTASMLQGHIAVVCAGTSDLPVAEEAAITADLFGAQVDRITDVGVAGLQRLLAQQHRLRAADVVIVCAGMEGALPSVVGGLVASPVIAVPTSVGYGASFAGATALLGMLNSCSPNVTVVNIDNGFGAGYTATLIARAAAKQRSLTD